MFVNENDNKESVEKIEHNSGKPKLMLYPVTGRCGEKSLCKKKWKLRYFEFWPLYHAECVSMVGSIQR